MPKISEKDLKERYAMYTNRVKEIKREFKETEKRAMQRAALEFNVTHRTIENAMNNRKSTSKTKA